MKTIGKFLFLFIVIAYKINVIVNYQFLELQSLIISSQTPTWKSGEEWFTFTYFMSVCMFELNLTKSITFNNSFSFTVRKYSNIVICLVFAKKQSCEKNVYSRMRLYRVTRHRVRIRSCVYVYNTYMCVCIELFLLR